jgi:hypothetical protein
VRKLIIASAFYKSDAVPEAFWKGFETPDFSHMPQIYKDEYLKIGTQEGLMNMFNKDAARMYTFKGWTDEDLQKIQAPIVCGNWRPGPTHTRTCRQNEPLATAWPFSRIARHTWQLHRRSF